MNFLSKLRRAAQQCDSWLCVGLDPVVDRLPAHLPRTSSGVAFFCQQIIRATAPSACAFKPNIAFFEALGDDAFPVLRDVVQAVPEGIPVILDAKRGDIGSTAEMYAEAYYDRLGVDAVTVNPYMGWDAIQPFIDHEGKTAFVLCLTSNPSAADFQTLDAGGSPLYARVAEMVLARAPQCGLVVGATRPEMLGVVRSICPEAPLLIPGVGAQGGDIEESVRQGSWSGGGGALINASRSILLASRGEDFAEAAAGAAETLRATIARCQPVGQRNA